MEFTLSDERRMLQDSLRGTLARGGSGPELWAALTEMGAASAVLPEQAGGFGGTGADIALVAEEIGRAGAVVPLIDSVILGAGVLAAAGGHDALVSDLAEGRATCALADLEPGARYSGRVACRAQGADGALRLHGAKTLVVGGDCSDWLLVTARGADEEVALYLVAADAPGVARRMFEMMAGGQGADLALEGAPAQRLGPLSLLERPRAAAVLALCADAVGGMERVIEITADYLRTRRQFGQPIGKFQVLAHRMADLLIEVEQARAAVVNLADALDGPGREIALSAAKVTVGETARLLSEEAIQMHGGIGMTQEYGLRSLVLRLLAADARFGDADYHLERFAALNRPEAMT